MMQAADWAIDMREDIEFPPPLKLRALRLKNALIENTKYPAIKVLIKKLKRSLLAIRRPIF
jgi:hypothetical protein